MMRHRRVSEVIVVARVKNISEGNVKVSLMFGVSKGFCYEINRWRGAGEFCLKGREQKFVIIQSCSRYIKNNNEDEKILIM